MRLIEKSKFRWALPGLKIKRYILLIIIGLVFLFYALSVLLLGLTTSGPPIFRSLIYLGRYLETPYANLIIFAVGLVIIVVATLLIAFGIRRLVISIASCLAPEKSETEIMDVVFAKRKENLKKKIVVIGGGTGTTSVLEGLKGKFVRVSAIITVADSGGSSGRLRRELKVPPPGDIRNCLVSLSKPNTLSSRLLQYRFSAANSCLDGHNLGNILIAGMTKLIGDFGDAVVELGNLLDIEGETMPFTTEDVVICAEFEDGKIVEGEADITNYHGKIKRIFIKPEGAKPYIKALERISEADVIVIGPGSLFTSITPPLLFPSIIDTIRRSRAKKVFVTNIMTEPGETDNFSASDHIKKVINILGEGIIDYAVVNTGAVPSLLVDKYHDYGADVVKPDADEFKAFRIKTIIDDMVITRGDLIRHNPEKLGEIIFKIAKRKA